MNTCNIRIRSAVILAESDNFPFVKQSKNLTYLTICILEMRVYMYDDKNARRGYVPEDKQQFTGMELQKLKDAAKDTLYLLNRGYSVKNATTFVGNHYMLSERQRLALARSISPDKDVENRKKKETICKEVHIDGFNTIITLEVALSHSLVMRCMDGTIRDLAGLRGTYRIIEQTKSAIHLLFKELEHKNVEKAIFYLDAPVSNSGRLKTLILEAATEYLVTVEVVVIHDVDRTLQKLSGVISSDAIILNHCKSYINILPDIISKLSDVWMIELWE